MLGTSLDPLGDRLLSTVAVISLSVQWLLPLGGQRSLCRSRGRDLHFSANLAVAIPIFWGKLSALLQIVAVDICAIQGPREGRLL